MRYEDVDNVNMWDGDGWRGRWGGEEDENEEGDRDGDVEEVERDVGDGKGGICGEVSWKWEGWCRNEEWCRNEGGDGV